MYGVTWRAVYGTIYSRGSSVTQLLCAQSEPGWVSNTVNYNRFYINTYASAQEDDGDCLDGMGQDQVTSGGSWMVQDNTNGNIGGPNSALDSSGTGEKEQDCFGTDYDGNRVATTIYLDDYEDHLGTGTYTWNDKTYSNGLNMRLTLKAGEHDGFYCGFFQLMNLENTDGSTSKPSSSNYNYTVNESDGGIWYVGTSTSGANNSTYLKSKFSYVGGTWSTSGISAGGRGYGGSYVNQNDVYPATNGGTGYYVMVNFAGTGPLTEGTTTKRMFGYSITHLGNSSYSNASTEDGNRWKGSAIQSVWFYRYDTTELRNVLELVQSGEDFDYNGTHYEGKGTNPQSWMYGDSFSDFQSAIDTARSLIANFKPSQAQIDAATANLLYYYNLLSGYVPTGTITVRHMLKDSTEELVPAQTFSVAGTWAQQSDTSLAAIANGAAFSIQALVDSSNNCTLKGYKVSGPTVITGSASFSTSGTTLKDDSGNTIGSELIFYYEPAAMQLKVGTGIYTSGQQYVYTTSVNSGTDLNDTSATTNFTTIKDTVTSQYGQPSYTVYGGMYESSDYSGTAIDGVNVSGGASSWLMPATDTNVYVKWAAKPVKLQVITSYGTTETDVADAVTPSMTAQTYEMGTVTFAEPSEAPEATGMNFVNYYTDDTYTETVTWPITADYYGNESYGITESTDDYNYVTVYAKYVDLNNKIVFDTQGGTIADGTTVGDYTVSNNEMSFAGASFPTEIGYPVPTRAGYTFTGWVTDTTTNTPVSGWTRTDSTTDTGVSAIEDGTHAQSDTAGFICYATWQANTITITFNHAIPSTETNTLNSKNQSGQNYYYQIFAKANSQIDTSLFPSTPRRYGYKFNYWSYNGKRLDTTGNYATSDMTLTAIWKASSNTVFAELITYVNVAGEDQIADVQHDSTNATTPTAQKGDVVKIRMEVGGNFYAGSSSWIFAYDADFFEKVTSVTATANTENSYISGIKADVYEISGTTAANAYDGMMDKTDGNVIDPYTGSAITNPGYIQVTIDPDISQMTNGYKTVSFNDAKTYMLEITLQIKADTTKTEASFWMPGELVRTADNIMGDTYVAYTPNELSLDSVQTDAVDFDAYPVSTVNIVPETREQTTITAKLPDTEGGAWSDGSTGLTKTYTGPAEAEILSTYTTDNVNYRESTLADDASNVVVGFPVPTKEGYHINGWNKVAGTNTAETWDSYSYANSEQDGNTYEVEWAPDEFTYSFYSDEACTTLLGTTDVVYDQVGVTPYTYNSTQRTEFIGWIRQGDEKTEENVVDFTTEQVTGDESFYAYTKNARRDVTLQAVLTTVDDDGNISTTSQGQIVITAEVQKALGIELRHGTTLKIVEEIPENPAADTSYIDIDTLNTMFDGNYTYTTSDGTSATLSSSISTTNKTNYDVKASALPLEFTIAYATSGNTFQVEMEGAVVEVTFKSGSAMSNGVSTPGIYTGSYDYTIEASGQYTWKISGKYGESYDFDAATAGVEAPFGYTLSGFNPATNHGVYRKQTFTAAYTAVTVNVHYLDDNGTEVGTGSATFNKSYGVTSNGPTAATMEGYKPGYTFSGWLVADPTTHEAISTTAVTSYTCSSNPSANIKRTVAEDGTETYDIYFIPVYSVNTYNVIYKTIYTDTSAASQYGATETAEFGSTYTVNGDAAAVTGYTFDGWYNESAYADKTVKVTSFTVPADTTTLYGYYVPNTYNVYFWNNDGTDAKQEVPTAFNSAITAPESPTLTGYEFKGWATSAESTTPVSGLGTLTETGDGTVNFYAVWEAKEVNYYIDYYYENLDGEYVKDDTLTLTYTGTVGQEYSVSDNDKTRYESSKTGYSYVAANNDETAKAIPTDGELRFAVKYTLNTWTYSKNIDGTVTEIGTYKYGATLPTDIENPTKVGYTFAKWLNVPEDGTMPNYDVTITASWDVNRYTMTFISDGETVDSQSYAYGAATQVTTKSVTKEGYTFGGWYEDGAETEYTFGAMPANDVTLYAKWTINTHTVTYNTNGGNEIASFTAEYGTAIPTVDDPVKTGYRFTGWSETIPATMPDRDVNLAASWEIEQYTVTFDKNYEGCTNDIDAKTAVYNGTLSMPTVTREGYTFDGWYTADNVRYDSTTVFGDLGEYGATLALYAHWTINGHTVTYKLASGEAWADGTAEDIVNSYDYGSEITEPAAPVKTGYTFAGWTYKNADTNAAYTGTTVPDFNLTATATWTVNQYTITFAETGDTTIDAITGDYGKAVGTVANPTKAGYDFAGWDKEIPETIPAEDVTITAQWNIHKYTVDFDMGGATPQVSSKTAEYNATIELPVYGTDFTRTGYSFDGWYDDAGNKLDGTYTLPAMSNSGAHVTLTARWTVNELTITFDSNGGTAVEPITQAYGTDVTAPAAPEKAGYDFAGWYENEDCTGSRYSFTTMPAESITLHAKWTEHNYTVVFVQPDDYATYETEYASTITFANHDAYETTYVTYGSAIGTIPASHPDMAYYDFIGWVDEDGNVVTELWIMPAASQDGVYYVYPSYEAQEVTLEIEAEGPVVIENEVPPVTGYIYNAGDQQSKTQIESLFDSTGYSEVVVRPSKGKYCGTGTRIEVYSKTDMTAPVEVYYLIVYGDVTGDAICRSNDYDICNDMVSETEKTWYVDSAKITNGATADELRACYELAADVNGDGIFNSYDTTLLELYTHGLKSYVFDTQLGSDTYYKYVTVAKA